MDHQGAMCTRHGAHQGEAEGFRVVRIQGVALSGFEKMREMAMEMWGKHGEKPWKSMGNQWEKLGKSGRSGETQRVQWSRLP